MSKELIKLMVEEEAQKCLREKVRDIVAKKLLSQTEKIEQLVTESLNNLISAETETYDAVYDHITGAEYLSPKCVDDEICRRNKPFRTIECDMKNRMTLAKEPQKLIPNTCNGVCMIDQDFKETTQQYSIYTAEPQQKFYAVKAAQKNTEFRVHKYPSETDPSVVISEIRRGKLISINVIINDTCDCAVFKASCLPKTEIEDYKIPTCEHMEFVKSLKIPVATNP
jgi:hypothetical protein